MHTSEDRERFRMKSLNLDSSERTVAKTPRAEGSQIRLTQNISITQEELRDASSRPRFEDDF